MISTMLETSFRMRSGNEPGIVLPTRARLHRYMASANSGNMRRPDLVVSARVLLGSVHGYSCHLMKRTLLPNVRKGLSWEL